MRARLAAILTLVTVAAAMASPGGALAQQGLGNPLAPGLPQPAVTVPTTTTPPSVTTSSSASSSGGSLGGGGALAIAIGALAIIGGIAFFIWHDSRRRAPVRHRAAAAAAGAGASGSKARPKPRRLSPAERRRRKRGRAK